MKYRTPAECIALTQKELNALDREAIAISNPAAKAYYAEKRKRLEADLAYAEAQRSLRETKARQLEQCLDQLQAHDDLRQHPADRARH